MMKLQSAGLTATNTGVGASDNSIQITVVGIAATTINWYITTTVRNIY